MSTNFFEWYQHWDKVVKSKNRLEEDIFFVMELMHQQYLDIMSMPYPVFLNLLKWKDDIEKEKKKMLEERNSEISTKQKTKQRNDICRIKRSTRKR